jgi:hypothetical protein
LFDLKSEFPPGTVERRNLRLAVRELRISSERLVHLKRECESELRANPSLIWQVRETRGETFWSVWEEIADWSTDMGR